MLSDASSEVSACFTDVTSITTCRGKFIYDARTEPIRERIFHVKQVFIFEGSENKFDVNRFAKSIDKFAHPMLCYTENRPKTLVARQMLRVVRCHLLLPWKYSGGLCYLKHARDRDSCGKITNDKWFCFTFCSHDIRIFTRSTPKINKLIN